MNKANNKIEIGGIKILAIDLTQPLKLDTEVFPGDPKLTKEVFTDIVKTGYEHYIYKIGDHNFQPHADAPKHQNQQLQDRGIEVFNNMDYIFNNAYLIDLSQSIKSEMFDSINYLVKVTKEDLLPYKEYIKRVGAVLIRTGYDKWLEANKKHIPENIPYLTGDAVEFISSFNNLKVIGIDSITIDPIGEHFAHKRLTPSILVLESLVHLDQIPANCRNNFTLQSKPITIVGATGAPVAAFAYIRLE